MKQSTPDGVNMLMHKPYLAGLGLLTMLFLGQAPAARAEEAAISLSSDFSASLQFNSEQLNSPKQIPAIEFTGSVGVLGNKVRVELVNGLTLEPMLALLDIDKGSAALLYPDSLNGERMPLGDDFRSSYLGLFCNFVSGRELGEVKGWKLARNKLEGGGTEFQYTGGESRSVSFRRPAKGAPQLLIKSPKLNVSIRLNEINTKASLSPADFTVPADYAMRDSDTKLADFLPSL